MRTKQLAALLLIVLSFFGSACLEDNDESSDAEHPPSTQRIDGELTLEEYFQELRRLGDEAREEQEPLAAGFERRMNTIDQDSPRQALQLMSEIYQETLPLVQSYLAELEALDPPPEVETSHQHLVEGVRRAVVELETMAQRFASADSFEDVRQFFPSSLSEGIEWTLTALEPCFELQDIAIEHDIDVNLACADPEDWNNPLEVTRRSEFLTPVAQAQKAGITPYWLGKEFPVGELTVKLTRDVELHDPPDADRGFSAAYATLDDVEERGVTLNVITYSSAGNGAEWRRGLLTRQGLKPLSRPVIVGSWPAELVAVPAGTRPVNALSLYIDVGEMDVVVTTSSGSTGVPGTDWNPLLDSQLFIDTVAAHLRPYSP